MIHEKAKYREIEKNKNPRWIDVSCLWRSATHEVAINIIEVNKATLKDQKSLFSPFSVIAFSLKKYMQTINANIEWENPSTNHKIIDL